MEQIVNVPFNDEQVKALNDYQGHHYLDGYLCCGHSHADRHVPLVATTTGLVCPTCGKNQTWAFAAHTEINELI